MSRTSHATRFRPVGLFLALVGLAATSVPSAVLAGDEGAAEEKLFYDSREEIPGEFQWDLEPIFPDIETWEATLKKVDEGNQRRPPTPNKYPGPVRIRLPPHERSRRPG